MRMAAKIVDFVASNRGCFRHARDIFASGKKAHPRKSRMTGLPDQLVRLTSAAAQVPCLEFF